MLRQTVLTYGKFFEGVEYEGGEKIEGWVVRSSMFGPEIGTIEVQTILSLYSSVIYHCLAASPVFLSLDFLQSIHQRF